MTILLLGANGQVGHELRRSLGPLGDIVATTRSGELPEGVRCEVADFDRPDTLAQVFELFPRLAERRRQLAGTLSGGEQQMTAIGRALMARPRLLMLDEPSLGLAPVTVQSIFENLVRINRDGVTVLLVEQNVLGALRLSHRAYVLENGAIVLEGTEDSPDLHVGVGHAAARADADALVERLRAGRPNASYDLLVTLGPVIGTHGGPGTLGLFWFQDDPV